MIIERFWNNVEISIQTLWRSGVIRHSYSHVFSRIRIIAEGITHPGPLSSSLIIVPQEAPNMLFASSVGSTQFVVAAPHPSLVCKVFLDRPYQSWSHFCIVMTLRESSNAFSYPLI